LTNPWSACPLRIILFLLLDPFSRTAFPFDGEPVIQFVPDVPGQPCDFAVVGRHKINFVAEANSTSLSF
jgi:hypothetical protein